jgi:hypothetical protein
LHQACCRGLTAAASSRARSTYDVPWAEKNPRAVFRGRKNEHVRDFGNGTMAASRSMMVNLSTTHADVLDARFTDGKAGAPELPIREHSRYKYALALDGVTGSSRLSRLLWCNSLVLKEASPWHEYFYRGLTPGVHLQTIFDAAPDDVLRVVARAQANESGAQARTRMAGRSLLPWRSCLKPSRARRHQWWCMG